MKIAASICRSQLLSPTFEVDNCTFLQVDKDGSTFHPIELTFDINKSTSNIFPAVVVNRPQFSNCQHQQAALSSWWCLHAALVRQSILMVDVIPVDVQSSCSFNHAQKKFQVKKIWVGLKHNRFNNFWFEQKF